MPVGQVQLKPLGFGDRRHKWLQPPFSIAHGVVTGKGGGEGSIMRTTAQGGQEEAGGGQGLLTWGPPAVEDMDVHEVLQILLQGLPVQPRQPVSALDTLGLPVCPIDALFIEGQPKRVGELASNQHLPGTQHVSSPSKVPQYSAVPEHSGKESECSLAATACCVTSCDLAQELVVKSLCALVCQSVIGL